MEDFLGSMYRDENVPLLNQIYQNYARNSNVRNVISPTTNLSTYGDYSGNRDNSQYVNYISKLENNNKELINVIQDFNMKYQALQKKHHALSETTKATIVETQTKWIQIGQELVMIGKDVNS